MSDDTPLAGTTALVTGATSGIGRETVRLLAEDGATVFVHGRDRERGEAVCETVTAETPGEARFYRTDFTDFDAVRKLAQDVSDDADSLDALVNNAGTWQRDRHLIDVPGTVPGDEDGNGGAGVEMTVAVNHCAHSLLTAELWGTLTAGDGGRVVTVASAVHRGVDFDLGAFTGTEGPSGQAAYGHSKLANVLFAAELARRAEGTGVTSNSCHPGVVPSTGLARETPGPARYLWKGMGVVGRLLPFGPVTGEREAARTQYYLASSPDVADVSGEYFADRERATPSADARSETNARKLWEWTAETLAVDPNFPRADATKTQFSSG